MVAEAEGTVESGQWTAKWGVYGPFEKRTGFWIRKTKTYWEWRAEFYKPDGELIKWYSMEWSSGRDYRSGEAPTHAAAAAVARPFALRVLEAERRSAEPVETGTITLPAGETT